MGDDGSVAAAAAYEGFEGRVGRTVAGSESWWPPPPTPPEGSPNVVVILADDLGFSDLGCYGSEIATPHLDAMAAGGLRFTNFHVTPMCSPTRAALLTGLNPHLAGVGHVAHSDSGFPGYVMELADDAATVAEILRGHGYFTAMTGKWHLTKDSHCSDAGPRDSWPCQRGFDRFYGILDGFTNLHHPHRIVEDNHAVETDTYPDDYYFTDDITERAIDMIRSSKASNPARPFFCYVSHGAVHAPLHAPAADIEQQRGRYDVGWDAIRHARFERMVDMGLLPPDTALPPANSEPGQEVPPWDELDADQQRLAARYMEVYAAMVEGVDRSVGRLRAALAEMGELENTVMVFTSDNGASREGEAEGTTAYYVHLLGETDVEADLARIDEIGGPTTIPHYPRGWAMAGNTPYRLYKINTHAGGHQVPFIVDGPVEATDRGATRGQYQHVTDLLPTVLDLVGVSAPGERHGRPTKPVAGTSFVSVLADPSADSTHPEQYYEMLGHRGFYRDGWEAVTLHLPLTEFGDHEWELYDLRSDPTETTNLAAEHPERVAELGGAWEAAAWDQQVFPLDEGSGLKFVIRPPWDEVYERPVTLFPHTPTLERWRSLQLIQLRSVDISIEVDHAATDEGILLAHGDQGGGYAVWIDPEGVHLAHNDGRGHLHQIDGPPPPVGERRIGVALAAPGGGVWNARLLVDDEVVGDAEGWRCLFPMAPFEGIDVGLDRRSPVVWSLYEAHGAYPYTGRIRHVTYTPGEPAPDAPVNLLGLLREIGARFE